MTGCAGPRPLKGGRAVTTHQPAGLIEQTLVQGENPSRNTKQAQESVKVRNYTLPAGSRVEQSQVPVAAAVQLSTIHPPQYCYGGRVNSHPINLQPLAAPKRSDGGSTINSQPPAALMVLPSLVVGNELLILGGVGVAVGGWFLAPKAAKPEPISRADFYAELVVLKDHIHAGHLAIQEKLDANQRELLAALERQAYSMRSSSWPVSWPASGPVSWTIRTE